MNSGGEYGVAQIKKTSKFQMSYLYPKQTGAVFSAAFQTHHSNF